MTLQLGTALHMVDRCAFRRWKRRHVPVVLSLSRDAVCRWMRFFLFSPCESDTIASAMPIMGFIVFLVEKEVGVPCADPGQATSSGRSCWRSRRTRGVSSTACQLIAWSLPGKGQSTSQEQLLGTCMHDRTYVIVALGAVC